MPEDDHHDRYLRKAQALSRAYEIEKKDRIKDKVVSGVMQPEVVLCYRCKKERPCKKYSIMETGRTEGAVSVSSEYVPLCEECSPKKKKGEKELTPKQITSLLRGARRGRL